MAEALRAKLDEFRTYLPLIACICNPGMRGRHWAAISDAAGAPQQLHHYRRQNHQQASAHRAVDGKICGRGLLFELAHAGFKVTSAEDESLHNLLTNGLLKFKGELQELSDAASREHALEKQLDKMQADWVRACRMRANA